ncbi:sulfotransferase [Candidatus Halobeggiatoa sp. HSG11]|nr:sulfotransferase [Candidatus Halobeggiatoa sp. HSG11]
MQLEPYRISLNVVDQVQLQHELSKFKTDEWHSTSDKSAIILTSVGGTLNCDFAISGPIKPTIFLERCPCVKQILGSLNTPISRCRLTKSTKINYNYHWFRYLTVYVPIITNSTFIYADKNIQMAVGEAWVVDTPHQIETDNFLLLIEIPRTNKVLNTSSDGKINLVNYCFEVLRPIEIEQLIATILSGINQPSSKLTIEIQNFNTQWQMVFSEFEHSSTGELAYQTLISFFNKEIVPKLAQLHPNEKANCAIKIISSMLLMSPPQVKRFSRSLLTKKRLQVNPTIHLNVPYRSIKHKTNRYLHPEQIKVLQACCSPVNIEAMQLVTKLKTDKLIEIVKKLLALKVLTEDFKCPKFERPIFIISAPRAGSTLLFNTMSLFPELWTIGEENHKLIEGIPTLHPSYRDFSSNRLTATEATYNIIINLHKRFVRELLDRNGNLYLNLPVEQRPRKIRLVEKTPKNALRIPFLKKIFPEAIFIYLYRDPKENINSMMEFWRSRRFIAHRALPSWPYNNWSFLLTPGWEQLKKCSIAEIAAYQWKTTNSYILNDLQDLPKANWCFINYTDLIQEPKTTIHKISEFAGINWDQKVEQSLSNPLPISPMTLSAPSPNKWRKHEEEINKILPSLEEFTCRLKDLKVD